MNHIQLVEGDITLATEDAIVNAANPHLLGGGGVDGAIHRAAGPQLLAECRKIPKINGERCPVGEARITTAGQLAARYVVHTVGPIYHSDPAPAQHLAAAYRSSLQLAMAHGCHSVALPAIACGVYGYPLSAAANIALQTCNEPQFKHLHIVFYLFTHEIAEIWRQTLAKFASS
ncbi:MULTISPECIES: O-acetyl-ADP-ribose deacetylase [Shewanella]|jgi:O-acetyl-ADP-ribose deacetylase (regulator of RNase III)|uniref:O-acetyl-ADP-ribose deacetylase n=1 Tax=Shewanella TaxID=22 RepID=UPI0016751822|nr:MULTISPECIES: O-acetyl-ADP-ribose deacetylase [Shewanella]MBO1272720.1 O-acetyl-ADP-ribose deacetylase [Shewanella sp. 4t3-1-2LB]MCL2906746.1 O-acetyl-ADP-ribose deacetylase [Shewanella fodinae]GGZ02710.1 macro domain-containing protein [Shewanella fodinae]